MDITSHCSDLISIIRTDHRTVMVQVHNAPMQRRIRFRRAYPAQPAATPTLAADYHTPLHRAHTALVIMCEQACRLITPHGACAKAYCVITQCRRSMLQLSHRLRQLASGPAHRTCIIWFHVRVAQRDQVCPRHQDLAELRRRDVIPRCYLRTMMPSSELSVPSRRSLRTHHFNRSERCDCNAIGSPYQ